MEATGPVVQLAEAACESVSRLQRLFFLNEGQSLSQVRFSSTALTALTIPRAAPSFAFVAPACVAPPGLSVPHAASWPAKSFELDPSRRTAACTLSVCLCLPVLHSSSSLPFLAYGWCTCPACSSLPTTSGQCSTHSTKCTAAAACFTPAKTCWITRKLWSMLRSSQMLWRQVQR